MKIVIGIIIYLLVVAIICVFLKGATDLGNKYDEQMEYEMALKKIEDEKKKKEKSEKGKEKK